MAVAIIESRITKKKGLVTTQTKGLAQSSLG
jgi:hypothetical protein